MASLLLFSPGAFRCLRRRGAVCEVSLLLAPGQPAHQCRVALAVGQGQPVNSSPGGKV